MTTEMDLSGLLGEESRPIEFSAGLIGLEEWHRYVLVAHPAGEPLRLLQALDDSRVSLIVAPPRLLVPDYKISLAKTDLQALQMEPLAASQELPATVEVYSIISAQEEPFSATMNLLGPLVINWQTGRGRQIILSDSNYSPRFPIAAAAAEEKEQI